MLDAIKSRQSGQKLNLGKYCVVIASLVLLFAEVQAQSGAWTRKRDVPTGRVGATACVLDGKIYVMGGMRAGLVDVATNEVYDPMTDTWQSEALMQTAGSWPSSAVVNGIIYRIGGGYYAPSRKVEAYDPVTNIWTSKEDMPTARSGAQAALVNGVIYNIGGYSNMRNCEAYDPSTNTWTGKTDRPEAGGVLSVTAHNGIIYTFGGGSVDTLPSPTVYAYNPQTDTWTKKKDMPTQRFGFQTYLVGGRIYAIGGSQSQGTALATVEVYDPVSDSWTDLPNMPRFFTFHAGAVVNGKIYVIGGTSDMSTGGNELWEYDPSIAGVRPESNRPERFVLLQNYPNPFNPATTIEFRIQSSEFVTLKVYDLLGREVAVLVNEEKAPGSYDAKFDGTGLASGVYFYRLKAGEFVQTKKLMTLM